MEFNKKEIHTSILKLAKCSQLTLDDDFNIPDYKGDIEKIVATDGTVTVGGINCEEGKVKVSGTVYFKVLYITEDEKDNLECYEGEIPFVDAINVDGLCKNDRVENKCSLEDLSIGMINSRKIEVRALLENSVNTYSEDVVEATTKLNDAKGIECQRKKVCYTEIPIKKRDMLRIKEEVEIPQNKPNVSAILWSNIALRNMETKAGNDVIIVRGEIEIFVVYKASGEHMPVQYLYLLRSISKEIECQGAKENMILESDFSLGKGDAIVKADSDGESRIIGVEYGVEMNIKLFEDKELTILSDIYSPQVLCEPKTKAMDYENLIMRNQAKAKISYRKRAGDEENKLLQICHIYGNVELDDVNIEREAEDEQSLKSGINIKGVVKCKVMYISNNEDPLSVLNIAVPFEHFVDTASLKGNEEIKVVPEIDQLSASLLNSEEIEIKGQICLGISIVEKLSVDVITDMTLGEIDYEKKAAMPGIIGYVVKKDDTIWSIARKYYATTDSIKRINELDSDEIKEGDRLIIVKS